MHRQTADFLRSLAPLDLPPELPLYVMLASDAPEGLLPENSIGITGPRFDLALQGHLQLRCEWAGRGPALLVDNYAGESIVREMARGGDGVSIVEFQELLGAVCTSAAIHELAHIVSRPIDLSEDDDPEIIRELWIDAAALPPEECQSSAYPAWFHHEAPYIRALCHLCARSEAAGQEIVESIAFAHKNYGLSPLADYRAALATEIEASADLSFAEIARIAPPAAFTALWNRDIWGATDQSIETRASAAKLFADLPTADEAAKVIACSLGAVAFGDSESEGSLILAAADPEKPNQPKFRAVIYGGGLLPPMATNPEWPTIIDLAGLTRTKNIPIKLDGVMVGHVTYMSKEIATLRADGVLHGHSDKTHEVIGSARDGFIWFTKMQVLMDRVERLPAGKAATVNGRDVSGPATIVRASRLHTLAFDAHGDEDSDLSFDLDLEDAA